MKSVRILVACVAVLGARPAGAWCQNAGAVPPTVTILAADSPAGIVTLQIDVTPTSNWTLLSFDVRCSNGDVLSAWNRPDEVDIISQQSVHANTQQVIANFPMAATQYAHGLPINFSAAAEYLSDDDKVDPTSMSIWSVPSAPATLIGDVVAPGVPTNFMAFNSTHTSMTISLTEPGDDNGIVTNAPIVGFDARWSTSTINSTTFGQAIPFVMVPTGLGDTIQVTINDLSEGTPYFFAVCPIDAQANIGPPAYASGTTLGFVPAGGSKASDSGCSSSAPGRGGATGDRGGSADSFPTLALAASLLLLLKR